MGKWKVEKNNTGLQLGVSHSDSDKDFKWHMWCVSFYSNIDDYYEIRMGQLGLETAIDVQLIVQGHPNIVTCIQFKSVFCSFYP